MIEWNLTKYLTRPRTQLHKDGEGHPVDAREYQRVIESHKYLLHTRLDLSFPVGVVSRFIERPTVMHQKAIKQILKYLKGTMHYGLVY